MASGPPSTEPKPRKELRCHDCGKNLLDSEKLVVVPGKVIEKYAAMPSEIEQLRAKVAKLEAMLPPPPPPPPAQPKATSQWDDYASKLPSIDDYLARIEREAAEKERTKAERAAEILNNPPPKPVVRIRLGGKAT